ncbi:PqiC family protein [Arsukibacterium indicum]|uniref:Membrane integrity-associated transporter subunit PqiC n=1 Tax=Arsukibacterium indicum TaxID=2848612 RepID=A0ABS6MHL3_9GAMM|nr:ABC-type transport auxiliary lipoprotein family protein [Arsukibacterium indicum]MBV2128289.1 membrane integrity-associated transporter subunit PqiC [Arsukibacterium indicum]
MKLILMLAICIGVTACSSPAPVRYYQLAIPLPEQAEKAQQTAQLKALYLQPVRVANYLNGAGLVMQRSDVELIIASRHLWADALDKQLYRLVGEHLHARLPAFQRVTAGTANGLSLQLTIDRFYAQANGVAIISGHYTLSSGDEQFSRAFSYQQPLAADGYPALVSALSAGGQQLINALIADIQQKDL